MGTQASCSLQSLLFIHLPIPTHARPHALSRMNLRHRCRDSYFFKTITQGDIDRLDVHQAVQHYNTCFRNPAEFTLCFTGGALWQRGQCAVSASCGSAGLGSSAVCNTLLCLCFLISYIKLLHVGTSSSARGACSGNITQADLMPLVLKYLATIPPASSPAPKARDDITPLPWRPISGVVVEDVKVPGSAHMHGGERSTGHRVRIGAQLHGPRFRSATSLLSPGRGVVRVLCPWRCQQRQSKALGTLRSCWPSWPSCPAPVGGGTWAVEGSPAAVGLPHACPQGQLDKVELLACLRAFAVVL